MSFGIWNDTGRWKALAILAAAVMMISAAVMLAPSSDAEDRHYDYEAEGYGYHPYIELKGLTQTEYVVWDFDDGTPTVRVDVTEENPNAGTDHVFAEKGDYYVTATLYNTYDDGSGEQQGVTTKVILYHIYGYPVITFNSMGGSDVASYTGTSSNYIVPEDAIPADPTKTGHTFTGWYTEEACENLFDFAEDGVNKHITLYAGWKVNTYTVGFDLNGVEGTSPEDQTVEYGKLVSEPSKPVDSSEDARTFLGWYFEDELWSFTTPVTEDMTLVAKWSEPGVEYITVTFDGNGGTTGQSSIPAEAGTEIELPSATYEGFEFDGWYDGDKRVGGAGDKYTVPEADVILKAHWTEIAADDGDEGDENMLYLVGAIVCGVLAVVFAVAAFKSNYTFAVGTVVTVIVAVVLALLYTGAI